MKDQKSFADRIYDSLRDVPAGKVTTYRDLAHSVGSRAYRAVGQVLRNNPYAPEVPCHRVVSCDGKIGGFNGQTAGPAIGRKIALLGNGKIGDFDMVRFHFNKDYIVH